MFGTTAQMEANFGLLNMLCQDFEPTAYQRLDQWLRVGFAAKKWRNQKARMNVLSSVQHRTHLSSFSPSKELSNVHCCMQATKPPTTSSYTGARLAGKRPCLVDLHSDARNLPYFHLHLHVCTRCRGVETSKIYMNGTQIASRQNIAKGNGNSLLVRHCHLLPTAGG